MRYALNIDAETNRVLSATESQYAHEDMPRVDDFPTPLHEYLYIGGEFIHEPLPTSEKEAEAEDGIETISPLIKLEAQVTYTAMMTDTLLEV